MPSGIYGIHHLINDKWYVGQSVDIHARWNMHKSLLSRNERDSIHLLRAWKKYGAAAFEWVILEECLPEELDEKEIHWIEEKNSYVNGYNRTLGGGGTHGYKLTESHKEKIRQRATEEWANPVQREQRLSAMRIAQDSEEYRKKLSAAGKRNWANAEFKEKSLQRMHEGAITPEARKRKRASAKKALSNPKTKAKISTASKRMWLDETYRQKMANARAVFMDEQYRENASKLSKERWKNADYRRLICKSTSLGRRKQAPEVIQIETGKVFSCAMEASEILHIPHSHISSVCAGNRRTAGGYHWRYASDTQEEWENRRQHRLECSGITGYPKVICIETGEVFEQPKTAAEKIGVHPSSITNVCSGVQLSAGGFHWKYLHETEQQKECRETLAAASRNKDLGAHSRVRVICVETNTIYPSVSCASIELSINRSGISNALRGAAKSAGGYHWKYADSQSL